jgi:hypothetical protein
MVAFNLIDVKNHLCQNVYTHTVTPYRKLRSGIVQSEMEMGFFGSRTRKMRKPVGVFFYIFPSQKLKILPNIGLLLADTSS